MNLSGVAFNTAAPFMQPLHRNSQKRIYIPEAIYFVTTKTKGNSQYFRDPRLAELCANRIRVAQMITPFNLIAFVILPDHVHLLIQPGSKITISKIMHCIKRNISRSANIMLQNPHYNTNAGEDDHLRLQGKRDFAWQHSFHDHIIRSDEDLYAHIEYIRYNPEKHGEIKAGEPYPYIFIADESKGDVT